MSEQKVSMGRIVEFFPNTGENDESLPNGMQSAPAIVTQVFDKHVNLNVFVASPDGKPVISEWSVEHKSTAPEGVKHWDWPKKV